MRVFKFGGASISNPEGFINLAEIIKKESSQNDHRICIIISALGKTTDALEKVAYSFFYKREDLWDHFEKVKEMHYRLAEGLFGIGHPIFSELDNAFLEIEWVIEEEPHTGYNFIYDQIVSIGEILSSKMVHAFLFSQGIDNEWADSRGLIITDNQYRGGMVNWITSRSLIQKRLVPVLENKIVVCPGFIAGTSENYTTTLGREGSDFSAAIFASCLEAESLTLWKDVPGIMNSDPKINPEAIFIPEISYHEMAELSYYGASVIHPKTVKPLLEKGIPLWVKSFLHPEKPGTIIHNTPSPTSVPFFILKKDQMLLSLYSLDGGFILEEHLTKIYSLFAQKAIEINLAVNSALSFSVLIDQRRYENQIPDLMASLSHSWKVRFNQNLHLLTVRHDGKQVLALDLYISGEEVIIEVSTRHTLQKVYRPKLTWT